MSDDSKTPAAAPPTGAELLQEMAASLGIDVGPSETVQVQGFTTYYTSGGGGGNGRGVDGTFGLPPGTPWPPPGCIELPPFGQLPGGCVSYSSDAAGNITQTHLPAGAAGAPDQAAMMGLARACPERARRRRPSEARRAKSSATTLAEERACESYTYTIPQTRPLMRAL